MIAAIVILSIMLASAVAALAWLWASYNAVRRDRDQLETINEQHLQTLDTRQEQIGDLAAAQQVADARLASQQQQFDLREQQFEAKFKLLAADALRVTVEDFQKRAAQQFETQQEKSAAKLTENKQAIESLLKPVRESLETYQKSLLEAEKARAQTFGSLTEQTRALTEDQRRLRQETANLVTALRRPEVRGQWGEQQIKRLFDLAGMAEYVDYEKQVTMDVEGKSLRPDIIVKLPNDRVIVIDIKTPLDAYLSATEATDETQRADLFRQHASQIRRAATNLASKNYQNNLPGAPEFVVLHLPSEGALYAAVQHDPQIIDWAMEKNIVITTPTLMVALLKTVAMGWRERALTDNARQIADLGRELHERLATVLGYIQTVGSQLEKTVKSYNQAINSIESRLLPTGRKFADLKADSAKPLPDDIKPIETTVRELPASNNEE
ncbi:MAG: DNA recombination protein RmuC [Phycisphaerales bacterium]